MTRNITYNISSEDADKTIYFFLKDHLFPAKILTILKHTEGSVLLNNKSALMKDKVSIGDILTVIYCEEDESENIVPVNLPFEIIYEDDDIMVINKPADMPVHPAINNFDNTLANGLAYYFNQRKEKLVFRCINRLDRNTSGLLIVAKHRLSAAILSVSMKKREIHREYITIVSGFMEKPSGTIDAPIGRVNDSIIERFVDYENGDSAITHYEVVKEYPDITPFLTDSTDRKVIQSNKPYPCSLLRIHLESGRTHQIRVHMRHIGHPLLGDTLYNKEPGPLSNQALHSMKLSFTHPITFENMTFSCNSLPFLQDDAVKF